MKSHLQVRQKLKRECNRWRERAVKLNRALRKTLERSGWRFSATRARDSIANVSDSSVPMPPHLGKRKANGMVPRSTACDCCRETIKIDMYETSCVSSAENAIDKCAAIVASHRKMRHCGIVASA